MGIIRNKIALYLDKFFFKLRIVHFLKMKIFLLIILLIKIINCLKYNVADEETGKCETLDVKLLNMCSNVPYNLTRYPNFMKQKTQQEAANDAILYLPLVRFNCSPVLKLFLCSLYAPPCTENYTNVVKPCRELCEQARSGCEPIIKSFQLEWPEYLNCQRFPSFYSSEACIMDKEQKQAIQSIPTLFQQQYDQKIKYQIKTQNPKPIIFQCPTELKIVDNKEFYLIINDSIVSECGMPCNKTLFDKESILFSRKWILTWSTICFISTLFTILTFLIEMSRFKYPERPIIFISGCYLVVSLGYIIGSSNLRSNELICQTQKTQSGDSVDFLIQGVSYRNLPCTLLFVMVYYFGMSSSIWWVFLTLTWFLAAGLKWGHEAIEGISKFFHGFAWGVPMIKMVVILVFNKVDADILSGICYTGITDMNILRGLILAPLLFYLIMGTCFLFAGFISLFRIRNVMKNEGNQTKKLTKFMTRICFFSLSYMIPAVILIFCYFYEQKHYNQWMIDLWLKKNYQQYNTNSNYLSQLFLNTYSVLYEQDTSSSLSFTFGLYIVKYTMLLVVGTCSGFWILSKKTVISWKTFLKKIFNCFYNIKPSFKDEAAV